MKKILLIGLLLISSSAYAQNTVFVDGVTYAKTDSGVESAITAAGTNGTVVMNDGSYTLSSSLDITVNGINLRGSRNAVLRLANNTNTYCIYVNGAENVTLDGFTVDGNKANQSSGYTYGIVTTSDNTTIKNLYVKDTRYEGINASDCINALIENNVVEDAGKPGVDTSNYGAGIKINSAQQAKVLYNRIDGSLSDGIMEKDDYSTEDTEYFEIIGNVITGVITDQRSSIGVHGGMQGKIVRNNISDTADTANGVNGIRVVNYNEDNSDLIIGDNYIESVGSSIEFGVDNVIVRDNIIKMFGENGDGNGIFASGENIIIKGNQILGANQHGVFIYDGSSNVVISDNIIKNAGLNYGGNTSGIRLWGSTYGLSNVIINNNIIYDDQATATQDYGIWNTASPYSNLEENDNLFHGNGIADVAGI